MLLFFKADWIFFEVLLTLCWTITNPTKVLPTLSALDLSTATFNFCNSDVAFGIWTEFGTMLKCKFCKLLLNYLVLLSKICNKIYKIRHEINSVALASFVWMNMFFAINTESKLTMLALTYIFCFLNVSK